MSCISFTSTIAHAPQSSFFNRVTGQLTVKKSLVSFGSQRVIVRGARLAMRCNALMDACTLKSIIKCKPILTTPKISRRKLVLESIGFTALSVHPALAASTIPDTTQPQLLRSQKKANGLIIQDVVEGEGREAHEGDLVEVNYVCRRSNGYFVHSTVDQFNGESEPVILPLDEKKIIKGLKEVLIGMKAGGKRRALIPPSVGYINESLQPFPDEFGPRRSLLSHVKESLIFEVQVLKIL